VWPPLDAAADWRSELDAEMDDHVAGGGVGRVEWNITGTVLSTAGDDGKVRLWKGK
jgi:nucleoporin SEH1